jgi:hypothetical protein
MPDFVKGLGDVEDPGRCRGAQLLNACTLEELPPLPSRGELTLSSKRRSNFKTRKRFGKNKYIAIGPDGTRN